MSEQSSLHTGLTAQLPAVVWAIVIFVLSSIPSDKIPIFALSIPDKLIHGGIFSVLCFFCYRAFRHQSRILWLARFPLTSSVLLTMIYGGTDEIHQLFVPGRSADLFDVVADAAGGMLCAIAVLAKSRFHGTRRTELSRGDQH